MLKVLICRLCFAPLRPPANIFQTKTEFFHVKPFDFSLERSSESGGLKRLGSNQSKLLALASAGATRSAQHYCQSSKEGCIHRWYRILDMFSGNKNKYGHDKVEKTLGQNHVTWTLDSQQLVIWTLNSCSLWLQDVWTQWSTIDCRRQISWTLSVEFQKSWVCKIGWVNKNGWIILLKVEQYQKISWILIK